MTFVALEFGARCSVLGDVDQKMKNKEHRQLAAICAPGKKLHRKCNLLIIITP